jgi:hypothetical protein
MINEKEEGFRIIVEEWEEEGSRGNGETINMISEIS